MTSIHLRGIAERDLDLLLVEEIVASADFRTWFANQVGVGCTAQLERIARSVITSTGVSDLELTFRDGKVLTKVLVENKIDAVLQPRQTERYAERAVQYVDTGDCHHVVTVLVAPRAYVEGVAGFDRRLAYETLREWFENATAGDERARFKLHLLDAAIDRGSVGWTLVPDETATAFWQYYWKSVNATAPELRMPRPGAKPATSWFVRFRPSVLARGVGLIHKVPYGHVDLQFAGMADQLDEFAARYQSRLDPDMYIVEANKSLVVRIVVERSGLDGPPDRVQSVVNVGIQAAGRLRTWYSEWIAEGHARW